MSQPPQDSHGNRHLPSFVDGLAMTDPYRIPYSITKTQDPADRFQDITTAQFAPRCESLRAWHIKKHLGSGENLPALAFIGPQSPMPTILVFACIKTGYKLLLSSPRDTHEVTLALLQ
ncbi:aminoadipate-semialdehyde dehydrogenase [Fusarium heterosporum]|uniref:Aminoadipate-semialdehyde dehydrogenase n=1 Tax=Fusarium heterosporum TaxID=42747 RepID=A0A8H5SXK4_FUSHE|nr:aminoadipate-semialdehyde dehydrogenase [Fusarium heterosporum]